MREVIDSCGAGQGELPDVPALNIPCERCGMQLQLENNSIPEVCDYCGYRMRPASSSMWNNFLFVLRNRYFIWRGRATRKEFWSYSLFSFIFIITAYLLENYISYIGVGLIFLYFALPHLFLIVRRLHDIGLSGLWVKIYWILFAVLMIEMAATYLYIEAGHAYGKVDGLAIVYSHHDSILFALLYLGALFNFALEIIRLFFLVVSCINSNRGTNKFGPSRKYPLDFHV